ncbi:lytic murein transglycosylase [Sulfitobacter sp. SK012]|uniref:lytic murein transglycosylase n=1 Tax=Sulfitobacter sp. SK012 TaxID=1389005 RepID=UPI000E0B1CD0|nr:lytic murein transglycosylase [Sulfitobacter sp. SK012]AXI48622.1 lytic murein transglycosylase [Sulfitobacter sp. SK012]
MKPLLILAFAAVLATPVPAQTLPDVSVVAFQEWVLAFRGRAQVAGIETDVLDQAFADVSYDAEVVRRDRNQSEFTKTVWDYLETAVSDLRVANGRKALQGHQQTLDAISERFGVPSEIIVAIWGLESAYGTFRGSDSVIRSLASLSFDPRRAAFFEDQLMAALRILQSGDTKPAQMQGSWAGAMGHTQFMPTSFLDHAVDWTLDGKRDIWGDDPRDALASTAAYLKANGWVTGQPWGVEVVLPEGFDYFLANREVRKEPKDRALLGVAGVQESALAGEGLASILLPGGAEGVAFMIFDNFEVLESYNTADAYVIGVGHLADRIGGAWPLQGDWPREDRALSYDERIALQELLTAAGFDTQKIDAKIGPLTINALRAWQVSNGLVPDGYASPAMLGSLQQGL